jgi:ataxia telangiectasia mutated family protein
LFPPSSDLSHQDAGFDAVELALHEHNNDWLSVLQTYDVYSDSCESKNGISLALKNLGCGQTLSALQTQSNLLRGATRPFSADSAGFPDCVNEALQAVQHGRSNTVQISLETSLNSFLDRTLDLDFSRTGKMFRALADLQIMCDIDKTQDCDAAADQWFDSLWIETKSSSVEMLLRDHFSLIEPVLSLHSALVRAAPHGASKSFDAVLFRAQCARLADRFQIANSLLLSARKFLASASVSNATRLKWQLEQANYLKSTGSSNRAISHVQSVIQNLLAAPVSSFEVSRVNLLSMQAYEALADWSAQSQAASSDAIAQSYESALLATETDVALQAKHRPRILLGFGVYQLRLLQSLEEKQNSPEWKTFVLLLEQKRMDLEQLRATKPKNAAAMSDVRAMIQVTEKEYAMDQQQIQQFETAISGALVRAVELLGECLMRSQHYDHEAVYRLVSVWFSHSSNREVNRRMDEICKAVAHKFLPLRYQIASHLSKFQPKPVLSDSDYFLQCVASLTERMALQHPHHIIYTLISLRNVNVLRADAKVVSGYVPKLDKQDAAKALIQIVQNASEAHRKIVAAVDSFTATMLQISNTEFPAGTRLFRDDRLNALRDIKTLPIPTLTLPSAIPNQSLHAQADAMIRIDSFNSVIRISESGLTHPMILTVRGSDQREYEMLLKPKDDLRQDAVMEQLFGLCNVLLRRNDKTRVRNLQIRTYNVIPLTPAVGLLQFVSNTKSMSDLLKFAHDTFRPQDWTYDTANSFFSDKVGTMPTRQRYDQVCQNYKPAMHSWFTYQYCEPAEWFKRRQAYTRSVAVNSIVGYFAGIGDRHSGNILFDELTGEVVHIDLGVAFDQGRFLKTPENIPFRLTRELVDGMGICGVEGTFRRCCEESAAVLRANADMLTTIVQVFTQDPLYKWSLSPAKIQQLQRSASRSPAIPELEIANASIEGNSQAHRALIRFQQKLAGQEAAGILSVPGQVSKLINEARDPANLHTLFHGWKPWM